jgi:hypothetical protein
MTKEKIMKKLLAASYLRQRICACLFVLCCLVFICGCSVNWIAETTGAIQAFGPSVTAFLALLSAFGARIPASVLTTCQNIESQVVNDLNNVVLPLIEQYNQAEATAKPGIMGEIQSAMASCQANLGKMFDALGTAGLPASDAAKVKAIALALLAQLSAITAFIPVVTGHSGSVQAAVASGNIPLNAEQWASHFNQIVAHETGNSATDAAVGQAPKIAAPARA